MQIFFRRVIAVETNQFVSKGVLVKKTGSKAKVEKKILIPHFERGSEWPTKEQIEGIKKILAFLQPQVEDFIIYNFPNDRMIFSMEQMPPLPEDQLRNAIKFKMSEEYSIPAPNLVIDISKPPKGVSDIVRMKNIVFAAKKDILDLYLTKLKVEAKMPEPDMLIPDNLKYLEILDETVFRKINKTLDTINFVVCEDMNYSTLFTYIDKNLMGISDVPISLRNLIFDFQEKGFEERTVIDAIASGKNLAEILGTDETQKVIDTHYKTLSFETEKLIRNSLNNLKIANSLSKVNTIFLTSIYNQLTFDFEYNYRETNNLQGIEIKRMPIKQDFPEGLEIFLTVMGIAYRGVRALGKYKFV